MAKQKSGNLIGSWAFLIGIVIAVIVGLFDVSSSGLVITLVVIGIIVGLLNIADEEAQPFMLSGAVLVIVAALGEGAVGVIRAFGGVMQALLMIFVPATIIVAVKNVFSLARS